MNTLIPIIIVKITLKLSTSVEIIYILSRSVSEYFATVLLILLSFTISSQVSNSGVLVVDAKILGRHF